MCGHSSLLGGTVLGICIAPAAHLGGPILTLVLQYYKRQ